MVHCSGNAPFLFRKDIMAKYCVYCYNGKHDLYYHKSKDFILTKDYRRCAVCGRQRRLVIMRLFAHDKWWRYPFCHGYQRFSPGVSIDLFFYIPLNIILRIYRLIKKIYEYSSDEQM